MRNLLRWLADTTRAMKDDFRYAAAGTAAERVYGEDLMDDGPPTEFSVALDAYRDHLRELGYSTPDVTIMLIGFHAGWEVHQSLTG